MKILGIALLVACTAGCTGNRLSVQSSEDERRLSSLKAPPAASVLTLERLERQILSVTDVQTALGNAHLKAIGYAEDCIFYYTIGIPKDDPQRNGFLRIHGLPDSEYYHLEVHFSSGLCRYAWLRAYPKEFEIGHSVAPIAEVLLKKPNQPLQTTPTAVTPAAGAPGAPAAGVPEL